MERALAGTAGDPIPWLVETSSDGQRWRNLGKAWAYPGEPLLVHGASRLVRFRGLDQEGWSEPLERSGSGCMALLDLAEARRTDLMPGTQHLGLPVLLPGGETGRLLRFEASEDGYSWTYQLEFRGEVPERYRVGR